MRIRWRGLELPSRVVCEKESQTPRYAKFIVEPFERGFGVTVGNSLRRVLLSSIEGCAVTTVRIQGVQHEFSTVKGVYEDVPEILLNIKQLLVKSHRDGASKLLLKVKKKGEVTASDIAGDDSVEIVNKNLHIATLTDEVALNVEMDVRKGRGYITAEENRRGITEIGVIPVDSVFTPVTRVRYTTEATRVGQITNYDRLIMEIWTNGILSPESALVEAAKILRKHLNPFIQYFDVGRELHLEDAREDRYRREEALAAEQERKLSQPVTILELSVRASNCLESANVRTLNQLVTKTDNDLLSIRNFGKTSLKEVKTKLAAIGLSLGTEIPATRKEE
jgi:DNA-directed RNA polymerase subunit alpha